MSLPTSGRWAMQQAPGLASRSSPLKCLGKGMDSPRPVGAVSRLWLLSAPGATLCVAFAGSVGYLRLSRSFHF